MAESLLRAFPISEQNYNLWPIEYHRVVVEFTVRDEYERQRRMQECTFMNLPVTTSICNGKFHGLRTMTSYWFKDKDHVYKGVQDMRDSVQNNKPINATECPPTPEFPEYPFAVVEHLLKGTKHHNLSELFEHATLAFYFITDLATRVFMCDSFSKHPGCGFIVDRHDAVGDYIAVSTLKGWNQFLQDREAIGISDFAYRAVKTAFCEVYPEAGSIIKDTEKD